MCNASNHPANCRCGWGGDGHAGKSPGGFQGFYKQYNPITSQFSIAFKTLDSYTIPNARCPVCKAKVFFYQSEHGGKVFFDELGPPWPKHPCTDHNSNPVRLKPESAIAKLTANLSGEPLHRFGWHPLTNVSVRDLGFGISSITSNFRNQTRTVYVASSGLEEHAPYFIRLKSDFSEEIETLINGAKSSALGSIKRQTLSVFSDSRNAKSQAAMTSSGPPKSMGEMWVIKANGSRYKVEEKQSESSYEHQKLLNYANAVTEFNKHLRQKYPAFSSNRPLSESIEIELCRLFKHVGAWIIIEAIEQHKKDPQYKANIGKFDSIQSIKWGQKNSEEQKKNTVTTLQRPKQPTKQPRQKPQTSKKSEISKSSYPRLATSTELEKLTEKYGR